MTSSDQERMITEYKNQYAREGCNCLCWGHCCLFLWLIGAIIAAFVYSSFESDLESNYVTEHNCVDSNYNTYDVCCENEDDLVLYPNVSCAEFETICSVTIVECIIQIVVAIIGSYSLMRLNFQCLIIPMAWTIISFGFSIYFAVTLDGTTSILDVIVTVVVLAILGSNFRTVTLTLQLSVWYFILLFSFIVTFYPK